MSSTDNQDDENRLKQLGYKQELYRALDAFANFGVAFTILSEPMSVLPLIYMGLGAGGPQGMLVTWPIVSLFSAFVAASMSEIVSSYPTSGGLYYWSASLAGPTWAPFASYMTGYFNFLGLAGLCSGTAFAFGQFFVNCFIAQENPLFEQGTWTSKVITLFAAVSGLAFSGYLASFGSKAINVMGKACFWLNAVGLAVIVLSVYFTSPTKIPAGELFSTWSNLSGFPDAWAATISVLLACLTYTGYDSAAHLAEETKNPAVQGPRSIGYAIIGTFISGYFALFFILSTIDPAIYSEIYENGSYGLMTIFLNSVGLNAAVVFNVLLMLLAISNMFGLLMTHARMAFAFSRDGALPGSAWLHSLSGNQVPVRATIAIVVIDAVILIPSLHSNTMYAAINSFGIIGIYLSYLFPIILRVIRNDKFPKGPFNLGSYGVPVGIVSILFLCFASIALVLPTVYTDPNEYVLADNVTLDRDAYTEAYLVNFNWAPVVVAAVYILSSFSWFISARKWFKGPPIDTQTKWDKAAEVSDI
ncbi:amino acid/polyamine transporter I [Obelidium mucronatum]|nr:amino acid/polyamine transporter I [Obelidium mucronatum]